MKFRVIAKPNAKMEKVEKVDETTLRVWVKEPAKDNKANESIIQAVASYFNINIYKVRLVAGKTSKYKFIVIEDK